MVLAHYLMQIDMLSRTSSHKNNGEWDDVCFYYNAEESSPVEISPERGDKEVKSC